MWLIMSANGTIIVEGRVSGQPKARLHAY